MGRARFSSAGVGWCRWRTLFGALLLALAVGTTACGSSSDDAGGGSSGTETESSEVAKEAQDVGKQENPASQITDYVEYSGGKAGKADMSKKPIKIGWVNNQGGSVAAVGLSSTEAAEWAVKYVNENLGGIGGRPLKLVKCFVKNSEEEGLGCIACHDLAGSACGMMSISSRTPLDMPSTLGLAFHLSRRNCSSV